MDWIERTILIDPTGLALATWAGLLATVAGFWFTLVQVLKARRASEAAKEASRQTADLLRSRQTLTDASDGHAELQHGRRYLQDGNLAAAEHCLRRVHRLFSGLKGEQSADPSQRLTTDECLQKLEHALAMLTKGSLDRSALDINLIVVERTLGLLIGRNRSRDQNND